MSGPSRPAEFDIIARYFAPLAAQSEAALGLRDDAALVAVPAGHRQVVTTDMLVAGVHFLPDDPADLIARKMLRVNLSDVAAMGGAPVAVLLAIALSPACDEAWIARFAAGLAADLATYDIPLIGGDTTATPGPLTLSVTALGTVPERAELRRSAAAPGDAVFVSGSLGDAALGLLCLQGTLSPADPADRDALVGRYRLPEPRVTLGPALRGLAHAAADVSDGLVADLGHICETSGVGAEVAIDRIPLGPAARRAVDADSGLIETVLTGGDDYELVFTAPPSAREAIAAAAAAVGVPVTEIGRIVGGGGVSVLDAAGRTVPLLRSGWQHR
ncbi:MAG: thiamine-phosphate kinase [Rhodospirillales bacterium]